MPYKVSGPYRSLSRFIHELFITMYDAVQTGTGFIIKLVSNRPRY